MDDNKKDAEAFMPELKPCPKCGKPYSDMMAREDGWVFYIHGLEGTCRIAPKEEAKAEQPKKPMFNPIWKKDQERQPIIKQSNEELLIMAECLSNAEKLHQDFMWLTEKDCRHLAITMFIQRMQRRR